MSGCAVIGFFFWHFQVLGQAWQVAGAVAERSAAAYERIVSAQSAIAANDWGAGEARFNEAATLLREARAELATSLTASQVTQELLDVSGVVRSGDRLLEAGERIALAGQHVTRGVAPLLTAEVVAEGEESGELSLVEALEQARREFTAADQALAEAETALGDVRRIVLPAQVREQVATLDASVPRARQLIQSFLIESEMVMALAGAEQTRHYLLLFENNHELRPSGGFIGSVGLVNVDRGVVEKIDVQTVYDPDGQLKEYIAPPEPLRRIVDRWFMRDTNWFADWRVSATKAGQFFEKEGGPTVDGVIALTPEVIRSLLALTGPLEVPGYDVTVDADNFVPLTQDLVTYSYDREVNRPKQFLADVTPLLLNKVLSMQSTQALEVFGVFEHMIREKQLLLYFRDEQEQQRLEELNWGAVLPADEQNFLSVINANVGGHKSDQFVQQEIDSRVAVTETGDVDVVLTIRRTHRGPEEALDYDYPPGEDPAYKDNIVWQRVLVPKGAELLEAQGFDAATGVPNFVSSSEPESVFTADPELAEWQRVQRQHASGTVIGEEAGYSYFANWLVTPPGQTRIGVYHFRVPAHMALPSLLHPAQPFRVYIAKQPGDTRTEVRVEMHLPSSYRIVHTVPHDGVTQTSAQTLVYRGALRQDQVVGAVIERE